MARVKIPWDVVKSAYLCGVSRQALARQYGLTLPALDKRVVRGKWASFRTELERKACVQVEERLARLGMDTKVTLAETLNHTAKRANKIKGKLQDKANTLLTLTRTAAQVHGWNNSQGDTKAVTVQILNSVTPECGSVMLNNTPASASNPLTLPPNPEAPDPAGQ